MSCRPADNAEITKFVIACQELCAVIKSWRESRDSHLLLNADKTDVICVGSQSNLVKLINLDSKSVPLNPIVRPLYSAT